MNRNEIALRFAVAMATGNDRAQVSARVLVGRAFDAADAAIKFIQGGAS